MDFFCIFLLKQIAEIKGWTDTFPNQIICNYRNSYNTSKMTAEVGRLVEENLPVAPLKSVGLDHAVWYSYALGGGLGKMQYRYGIFFFLKNYVRSTQEIQDVICEAKCLPLPCLASTFCSHQERNYTGDKICV